jgi:hypothetical protein
MPDLPTRNLLSGSPPVTGGAGAAGPGQERRVTVNRARCSSAGVRSPAPASAPHASSINAAARSRAPSTPSSAG